MSLFALAPPKIHLGRITARLLLAAAVFGLVPISSADAAVIAAVDAQDPSGSPTQPGFSPWTVTNAFGNNPINVNGLTFTVSGTGEFDTRNRTILNTNPIFGNSLQSLLQDFIQSTGAGSTVVSLTVGISGLQPNTNYKITLWGLDATDNQGRGTSWYQGTNSLGTHITSFFNNNLNPNANPLGTGVAFSGIFNSGPTGSLSFFGFGDVNAQDPSLGDNNATIVILNGLQVETAPPVPEPTTLAVFGLMAAAGGVAGWRRRNRPVSA